VEVGAESVARRVTVTTTDDVEVSIGVRGQDPGDFTVVDRCGRRLARGVECTVEVRFTPTANGKGPRVAALAVAPLGAGPVASTALTGVGRPSQPPPPAARIELQTPPDQTVAYGSTVVLRVTAVSAAHVTLSAPVPFSVAGLTFTDLTDNTGAITGTVSAMPSATPIEVAVTGQGSGQLSAVKTFKITVVPADVAVRWAQPLLDLRVAPAIANALVTQPGGTSGDLSKATLRFEFTNVVSHTKTTFTGVFVNASGAATKELQTGELPLGAYTVTAELETPNPYFRAAPGTSPPTAVVINTDALGATVYALSDLLNLIKA
jgi:hypothetical protein